jgi:uncharacterized integral membrane protein
MALVTFGLGAVVGMAVLIFALENMEPVTLHYLFSWQTRPIPLFFVIIAAVGVGLVIAGLFGLSAYLRERRIVRLQRRQLAELEAELHRLRTLPIDAPAEASGVARPAPPHTPTGELSPR